MSSEIAEKLKKFNQLVRNYLSPKSKVILFGSYAKGKNTKWSDIDLAVIIPQIKDRLQEEINLRLKSLAIDERINPFIFSDQEFKQNSPLIWEIKKSGRKI